MTESNPQFPFRLDRLAADIALLMTETAPYAGIARRLDAMASLRRFRPSGSIPPSPPRRPRVFGDVANGSCR